MASCDKLRVTSWGKIGRTRAQSSLSNRCVLDQAPPEANGLDPKNFFAELKQRNVCKVAVAYAFVGWLGALALQFTIPGGALEHFAPARSWKHRFDRAENLHLRRWWRRGGRRLFAVASVDDVARGAVGLVEVWLAVLELQHQAVEPLFADHARAFHFLSQ